jgi:hypothetical protein
VSTTPAFAADTYTTSSGLTKTLLAIAAAIAKSGFVNPLLVVELSAANAGVVDTNVDSAIVNPAAITKSDNFERLLSTIIKAH